MSESSTLAPPTAAAPTFTRAMVCCGPVETAYHRAGRGATVVALTAPGWRGSPTLFPALARDFRLIVPELGRSETEPGEGPAFAVWLSGFLDGLGLTHVTLLADERFGAAALGSALIEPVRIGRLVVVLDAAAPDPPPATTEATLGCTGTKLVVTWLRAGDDAFATEVAAAVLGERRPAG